MIQQHVQNYLEMLSNANVEKIKFCDNYVERVLTGVFFVRHLLNTSISMTKYDYCSRKQQELLNAKFYHQNVLSSQEETEKTHTYAP